MAQLVTRIDEALALKVDEMILSGVAENRSELVRLGLEQMIDRFERERTGAAQASDETKSGSASRLVRVRAIAVFFIMGLHLG